MTNETKATVDYYNEKSELFANDTLDLEFSAVQDSFLKYLKPGSRILDFGCGSGRDSRYFLKKGFDVEAIDGSEEMVKIASKVTGLKVKKMFFNELNECEKYDGIFACASILHVPSQELPDIFARLKKAVKKNGYLYVSFKYGEFEGYRNGRYFTDLTETSFQNIVDEVKGLSVIEETITSDARKGREDEKWLNVILRKE
ncbi:MAG: class I SAM-dependent methyltransferase [Solobacterium sp.]|nr:class I SAM-dependent methyltransferase [Solobacterium sp.]